MPPNIDAGAGFRGCRRSLSPIVLTIARAIFSRREQARKASHSRDPARRRGMRNMADMLALDVRPLAKQDRDVGRCETGRPK
jgi:hypothetical protein